MSQMLYHATRLSNLASIMADGIRSDHYGRVHGKMEYAPAGPSVYLSRFEASNNLHTSLFDDASDPVVVLAVDVALLDEGLMYPDDAFFYMLDEDFLPDPEFGPCTDEFEEAVSDFSKHFGIEKAVGRGLLMEFADKGEGHYPETAKRMWREYLAVEGEVAYLGDVPPRAVVGVTLHPDSLPEEFEGPSMAMDYEHRATYRHDTCRFIGIVIKRLAEMGRPDADLDFAEAAMAMARGEDPQEFAEKVLEGEGLKI